MGSCVEGAIPLAVVGLNRRTNSFVMCGSSVLGHGGTSATAMRCWHCAAPSITAPSIGYLNAIDSDFERRKNHRMLLRPTRTRATKEPYRGSHATYRLGAACTGTGSPNSSTATA